MLHFSQSSLKWLPLSNKRCSMCSNMAEGRSASAREAMEALVEISKLLNTGLDPESLAICVKLCEAGVNPEALASVVQELRREAASLQTQDTGER